MALNLNQRLFKNITRAKISDKRTAHASGPAHVFLHVQCKMFSKVQNWMIYMSRYACQAHLHILLLDFGASFYAHVYVLSQEATRGIRAKDKLNNGVDTLSSCDK